MRTLVLPLLAAVLTLWSFGVSGQELYKVEVIVFERNEPASGDQERWPRNIELAYPTDTVALAESQVTPESEPGAESGSSASYRLLPSSNLSLTSRKNALDRDYRLRTLYHQAWLQPLSGPRQSRPVLIAGGKMFGGHQELGGIIEVSVNKFIHVDAHLWLAEFERNEGQVLDLWPPLPVFGGTEPVNGYLESGNANTESFSRTSESEDMSADNYSGAATAEPKEQGLQSATTDTSHTPFLVKEIVTLHQSRRMRSNEVHYLDHPKLGVLVQVEKYPSESAPQ